MVVETPQLTATIMPTSTITPTIYPTPTPFPLPYPKDHCGSFTFSPYSDWVAWVVCPEETCTRPCLRVETFDGSLIWEIPINIVEEPHPWSDYGFTPIEWSSDGKYLYFIIQGSGDAAYASDTAEYLMQLELSNGKLTNLSPSNLALNFAFTISPDQNKAIYIPNGGPTLVIIIQDISTNNLSTIELGEYSNFFSGNIVWSPDETKFAFGIEKGDDNKIEIFVVTLSSLTGESIVEIDYGRARPKQWVSEFEIVLELEDWDEILDIQTGEFTTATPHP